MASQLSGPRPGGMSQETGLRTRRHHQHHGLHAGPGGTPWNPGSMAFKRRGSPVPWRPR